jgi:hypothetical protein
VEDSEGWLDDRCQRLLTDPAKRQARKCDTKLRRGKVRIEVPADMFNKAGAHIALLQKRVELSRAHLYNGKFARDKKSVQRHKGGNCCQLSDNHHRWIPMGRNVFGEPSSCQ